MAESEFNLENVAQEPGSPEDYERVPLKQRLKLLLASRRIAFDSDVKSEIEVPQNTGGVVAEQHGNVCCHSDSGCSTLETMVEMVSRERIQPGDTVECKNQENQAHNCMKPSQTMIAANIASGALDSVKSSSFQRSLFLESPGTIKVEHADGVENPTDHMSCSSETGVQSVNFEPEMTVESFDELDHVVLKERLRRLLTSRSLGPIKTIRQENSSEISHSASATTQQPPGKGIGELRFGDKRRSMCENQIYENDGALKSDSSRCTMNPWGRALQESGTCSEGDKYYHSRGSLTIKRNDVKSFSNVNCSKYEGNGKNLLMSTEIRDMQYEAIQNLTYIKVEPPNYCEFQCSDAASMAQMSSLDLVKTEAEISGDPYEDKLDHILLSERMKLLSSRKTASFNVSKSSECMSQTLPSALGWKPIASTPTQSLKINRPRKRRKTVTDSVETAMEEDAPGLLQVLVEKGVSVNEIKLYGEPESNDALDDLTSEGSFADLEEVMTKLFSRREPLLKFGPLRCTKGEKASYCLECLFSLVEQARYLQFRNWPVEWGWCRELQSFIFVFERHNRIVLERPEYGYATYFFELADSLPIDWQIKRLVIAMKLTNCSRITLLENKSLKIGDDMTEGEAKVMMEYGWIPNTGLGTLLNYYDRVVHDRKNEEKDRSEWRSKIGKLLMDGYNGGTIVSSGIPVKVTEYDAAHSQQLKLEVD